MFRGNFLLPHFLSEANDEVTADAEVEPEGGRWCAGPDVMVLPPTPPPPPPPVVVDDGFVNNFAFFLIVAFFVGSVIYFRNKYINVGAVFCSDFLPPSTWALRHSG